jgi:hypothetical protein
MNHLYCWNPKEWILQSMHIFMYLYICSCYSEKPYILQDFSIYSGCSVWMANDTEHRFQQELGKFRVVILIFCYSYCCSYSYCYSYCFNNTRNYNMNKNNNINKNNDRNNNNNRNKDISRINSNLIYPWSLENSFWITLYKINKNVCKWLFFNR